VRRRAWVPLASGAQIGALVCGAATNLLYARLLAPAEIGRLAVLVALATGLVLVADSGLQLLLAREMARGATPAGVALAVLVRALPLLVFAWWAVLFAGGRLLGVLWHPLGVPVPAALYVLELGLALCLFQIGLTLHQGLGSYGRRSLLLLANGVLTTATTAVVFGLSASLGAAVHATAAAYAAVGVAGLLPLVRRERLPCVPLREVRALAARARPLWVNSGVTFAVSSADVLLAAALLPIASVGYYQILKKLALVVLAPLTTLLPLLYASFSRLPDLARAQALRRAHMLACGLIAGGLVAAAPVFPSLIGFTFGSKVAGLSILLVALIAIGGLQFSHNLFGYFLTAGGSFRRPLLINAGVVAAALATAPALATRYDLRGFLAALALGNVAGLAIAAALAARPVLAAAARTSAAFAGLSLFALWLATLPTASALPLGLVAGTACIALTFGLHRAGVRLVLRGRRALAEVR
jgi:O-antigen/teichoic acid export membrane protein